MGLKRKPICELGAVQTQKKGKGSPFRARPFRARMQRRDEAGVPQLICGPRRRDKLSAEKDLEELRAAGEKASPDKAWSAMVRKKRHLQKLAHGSPPKHSNTARARVAGSAPNGSAPDGAAPRARRKKAAKTEGSVSEPCVWPNRSAKRGPEFIPRASDITMCPIPRVSQPL